ncbi:MAG: NAD(+) diphosphatase [Rhodospirillales bacterium]
MARSSPMIAPLPYTDCPLDRATHLRADPGWVEARRRDRGSVFVAVCRDRNLITGEPPRALLLRGDSEGVSPLVASEAAFAFLGVSRSGPFDGAAWFAVEADAQLARPLTQATGGAFTELRRVSGQLPAGEAAVLAYARALMHWHRRHRFCGVCGRATAVRDGGHSRLCLDPGCGTQHFPRTDPAMIVLVTRNGPQGEACLLARQAGWPQGLVSTLAGFVEPGETAEAAVVREVREEVGIDVGCVRYAGSQPWPFPSSLMLAFRAVAPPGAELTLDPRELESGRWFSRDEVVRLGELGLKLPTADSIARRLIEDWLAEADSEPDRMLSGMELGSRMEVGR